MYQTRLSAGQSAESAQGCATGGFILVLEHTWHIDKFGPGVVRHALTHVCGAAAGAHQELQPSFRLEGVWGPGLQGQGGWP